MNLTILFVLGLAAWRLSSLLVKEEGPFLIFERMRTKAGIIQDGAEKIVTDRFFAQLLSCVWCTSVWVGGLLVLGWLLAPDLTLAVSLILALSTLAILIDRHV